MSAALADIERLVRAHLPPLGRKQALDADDDLYAAGLDSLAVAALLMDIERTFGIDIPAEQVAPETFASLQAIATAVERIRRASSSQ